VTWLIHTCVMTHRGRTSCKRLLLSLPSGNGFICVTESTYVWHDSFVGVTWLIHKYSKRLLLSLPSGTNWFIYVTWLIYMCDMWLIHKCDMTYSYVWHDSFIHVASGSYYCSLLVMIHMCAMTHWCVWHDSFICMIWLIHTPSKRLLLSLTSGTDSRVWHNLIVRVTWLLYLL